MQVEPLQALRDSLGQVLEDGRLRSHSLTQFYEELLFEVRDRVQEILALDWAPGTGKYRLKLESIYRDIQGALHYSLGEFEIERFAIYGCALWNARVNLGCILLEYEANAN